MAIHVSNLKSCLKYLAVKLVKLAFFFALLHLFAMAINPESFISIETSESFARWKNGFVSQENFDDLFVLVWLIGSLLATTIAYIVIIKLIQKIRSK